MSTLTVPRARRRMSFRRFFQTFLHRQTLRSSRSRLMELDEHLLSDIGISREEAVAEAARTDWDAPSHWCR